VIPAITVLAETWLPRFKTGLGEVQKKLEPVTDALGALFGSLSNKEVALIFGALVAAIVAGFVAIAAAAVIAFIAANAALLGIPIAIAAVGVAIALLVAHWDDIKAKTEEIWNGIKAFLDENFGFLRGIAEAAWKDMLAKATFAWDSIKNYIETALAVIRDIINIAVAILHGDWQAAWDGVKQLVSDVWDGIKTQIDISIELIKGIFAGFPSYLIGLAGDWLNAGGQLAQALLNGMRDMFTGAVGIAGDIAKTIVNAIVDLVNTEIIDRINDLLDIKINNPFGKDIHINPPDIPRIPSLAAGGIVPGALGVPVYALVHGGEEITRAGQPAGNGSRSQVFYGPVTVQVKAGGPSTAEELERMLRWG
jgi:hypothetical protein